MKAEKVSFPRNTHNNTDFVKVLNNNQLLLLLFFVETVIRKPIIHDDSLC